MTAHDPVSRVLRYRAAMAWTFSTVTLIGVTGFFGSMSLHPHFLSAVAFGRAVTVANVVAVGLIALFLVFVGAYHAVSTWADRQTAARRYP